MAVTATADDEFVDKISNTLSINSVLTDSTSRSNLHINDMRNIAHREDYLAHLLASGGKTVIYVNSREQSVAVARRERLRVPQLGPYIGFYNAGLSREERTRIEKLFRSGEIQVLVATSAFGEGIDIPDIRNVVLYHMPFSDVEFNQMSGRAGRDGGESWIHLLFGKRDATINDNLLKDLTPTREVMAIVYKKLMELQNESEGGEIELDLANLESQLSRVRLNKREFSVSKNAILTGLNVFDELGLISHRENFEGNTTKHFFAINKSAPKVELTDSTRYCEGLGEIENFKNFKNWIMNADIEEMTNQIIYPITPKRTERRN